MTRFPSMLLAAALGLAFTASPALAEPDARRATERLRATERQIAEQAQAQASRPNHGYADQLRERAARMDPRNNTNVQVVRNPKSDRPAYAYEMNGEQRVSVAEPRRVDHRPIVVRHEPLAVVHVRDLHAPTAAATASTSTSLHATWDAHSYEASHARHRDRIHARDITLPRRTRDAYAGYRGHHQPKHFRHHDPRPRSIHVHTGRSLHRPPVIIRPHVGVHRHRHIGPKFHTGLRFHRSFGSHRFHCPPARHHHRSHRSGTNFSLSVRF
ncbi:MAG: hypothetical protein WD118_04900 [Phycisphaeraceae bacterium]